MMKLFTKITASALKGSLLTAAVAAACASSAYAAPTFTFDPAAAGLNGTAITADQITVSDYAHSTFTSPSKFTEQGYLSFASFQSGGTTLANLGGLNSTYSLYIAFNGLGTFAPGSSATTNLTTTPTFGNLDSLTFSLFGANGPATFATNATAATVSSGTPTLLATGSLIEGHVSTSPAFGGAQFAPSANVATTFLANAAVAAFFSPQPFYTTAFSSFTNPSTNVSRTENGINITNGGGTLNFNGQPSPVPEPATLALLGVGLLGLGLRKRKQA